MEKRVFWRRLIPPTKTAAVLRPRALSFHAARPRWPCSRELCAKRGNPSTFFMGKEVSSAEGESIELGAIALSYVIYFVVNAVAVVLLDHPVARAAALALLALGVAALIRCGSAFARAVTVLALAFALLMVGPMSYFVALPFVAPPETHQRFLTAVLATYSALALSAIFGMPLFERIARRTCRVRGQRHFHFSSPALP